MLKRLHQISIGGVYLGEPVSEMVEYCKTRGYGKPVGPYHHITWDKDWSLVWADAGGKVSLLTFLNENLLKPARASVPIGAPAASH